MEAGSNGNSKAIVIENKTLRAVKCEKCGAKMFPVTLLKPHLTQHRRRQRWINSELRKLQHTFTHMRDFA